MNFDDLTPSQQEAVTYDQGPVLVVAGPGSGKTRVVTERIINLLSKGFYPYQILALTFTNKAAGEMKKRVTEKVEASDIWISTFHSFCARILRIEGHHIGLEKGFTIADDTDTKRYMKNVYSVMNIDEKAYPPSKALSLISTFKHRGLSPADIRDKARSTAEVTLADIYKEYAYFLKQSKSLDFDDLLSETVRLLENKKEIRDKYKDRFKHIMVDEYQDTNHVQYMILKHLTGKTSNVCVVGDPDQSVYSWRGANLGNILNFEKDYKDVKVIKLEKNFRSTQAILRSAASVIKNNEERKAKRLYTDNSEGDKVKVIATYDESEEGREVAKQISELIEKGTKASDIAVFYRTNAQSRVLEEAFRAKGVPYNILGSTNFYDRAEVKDALAYLRLLVNPFDMVSFERAVNKPARGVGKVTVNKIKEAVSREKISYIEACEKYTGSSAKGVMAFASVIADLKDQNVAGNVKNLVRETLTLSGLRKFFLESDEDGAADRVQNLDEIVNDAAQFELEQPEATLLDFLEKVALVSVLDSFEDNVEKVSAMTLHFSKGLEYPVVFVVGVEENLLPHENSMKNHRQFEEERRLLFVGMTRAKQKLFLTYAKNRTVYGLLKRRNPSRFLSELPQHEIETEDKGGFSLARQLERERKINRAGAPQLPKEDKITAVTKYGEKIYSRSKVKHPAFGIGTVQSIVGTGKDANVTVDFTRVGLKTLKLAHAPLEVI